jgi:hypothetical protein
MTLVDAASSILDKKVDQPDQADEPVKMSTSSPASESAGDSDSSKSTCSSQGPPMDKKLTFSEQLMALLDDETYSDVLTWMPGGKAFTIVNPKKFTLVEMPKLFNIRNMSSFVRKLTRWGFSRVHEKETMNSDIFKHKEFQQGNLKLCSQIKCIGRPPSSSSLLQKALPKTPAMSPIKPHMTKPSSSPSMRVCSTAPKIVSVDESKTLSYLNESLRSHAREQQLLQSNSASNVLRAAIESLRRERDSLTGIPDPCMAANALAIRRIIEASQQQQLAQSSAWLSKVRNEQQQLYAQVRLASAWGGLPSLY